MCAAVQVCEPKVLHRDSAAEDYSSGRLGLAAREQE